MPSLQSQRASAGSVNCSAGNEAKERRVLKCQAPRYNDARQATAAALVGKIVKPAERACLDAHNARTKDSALKSAVSAARCRKLIRAVRSAGERSGKATSMDEESDPPKFLTEYQVAD